MYNVHSSNFKRVWEQRNVYFLSLIYQECLWNNAAPHSMTKREALYFILHCIPIWYVKREGVLFLCSCTSVGIMLFKKRCSIINFPLFWRKCCQRQKIHRCECDTALVVFHHLSPISFAVVHSFSVVGFDKWSCPNPGNIICSHEIKADDSHHLQYPPLL